MCWTHSLVFVTKKYSKCSLSPFYSKNNLSVGPLEHFCAKKGQVLGTYLVFSEPGKSYLHLMMVSQRVSTSE